MEKLCTFGVAILVGLAVFFLCNALGRSGSTSLMLGLLFTLYGAWLGEELFTKIHH